MKVYLTSERAGWHEPELRARVGPRPELVQPIPPTPSPRIAPEKGAPPPGTQPAFVTTLSGPARTVSDFRREGSPRRFRPEVVESIRAEIAAGTFGGPDDIERTVDALLGEL